MSDVRSISRFSSPIFHLTIYLKRNFLTSRVVDDGSIIIEILTFHRALCYDQGI